MNVKCSCGVQQVLKALWRTLVFVFRMHIHNKWHLFTVCFRRIAFFLLINRNIETLNRVRAGPPHPSELDHMTPNDVRVDGVQSPEAEPPVSAECRGGWRAGEASKTGTPCTGLKTKCGPVLPGSAASTWAPQWKTPTGHVMNPLRDVEKSTKSFYLHKLTLAGHVMRKAIPEWEYMTPTETELGIGMNNDPRDNHSLHRSDC